MFLVKSVVSCVSLFSNISLVPRVALCSSSCCLQRARVKERAVGQPGLPYKSNVLELSLGNRPAPEKNNGSGRECSTGVKSTANRRSVALWYYRSAAVETVACCPSYQLQLSHVNVLERTVPSPLNRHPRRGKVRCSRAQVVDGLLRTDNFQICPDHSSWSLVPCLRTSPRQQT